MTHVQKPAKTYERYLTIKRCSRAYRRIKQHRIFRKIPINKMWLLIFFLVIIPSIYVASVLLERTQTKYYLFTGPKGGTYYALGPHLAEVLNRPSTLEKFLHLNIVPDFIPRESCGSLDNIYYINEGLAQLGLAEDGLPLHFEKPPKCSLEIDQKELPRRVGSDGIRLRGLMPLYKSPLHIVARKDLGLSDIRDIPPNAKVYLGPEGGATAYITNLILDHYGISTDRQGMKWNFEQAMQQLVKGNIEVGFFLVGLNSKAMKQLSQYPQLKLLTVEHAASMEFLYPYLEVIIIPGTTYKNASKDIVTVGTKTMLVTSTELTDNEVYEIADKLSHHIHDIIKDIPFNATKIAEGDPQRDLYYPLHEGAMRFYNHNPPLFLNPHALAGIGSYLTILFALYKVSSQFIRNYRIHRIQYAVERAMLAFHIASDRPRTKRFDFYIRKLRSKALFLLRDQRITLDDFHRINEYIKGHLPGQPYWNAPDPRTFRP
jgi:TRAP transporter TAXI family solute receptor